MTQKVIPMRAPPPKKAALLARFHAFRLTIEKEENRETFDAVEVRIADGPFPGSVELVEDADLNSGRIFDHAVVSQGVGICFSTGPRIWSARIGAGGRSASSLARRYAYHPNRL